MEKAYLCIDLKSFFASVECVERGLDPFQVNLVVADPSRGQGAICLAVSPHMKEAGVKNRCRIFEIPSGIEYITALPRMQLYMDYAAKIYKIFLKYISKEDIHVYSIDESFMDVTSYLKLYDMSLKELAQTIARDILETTGIQATAGMGPNLYLAKVALDILSKHSEDFMGYLDEDLYKQYLWHHRPITDFWQVGRGISRRLEKYGIQDMYSVAHCP
ncbi:MAG: DNA repair protein, partial [Erysipelotrichaceae bacterium]|nr:DNA repair protein [Erysipelotrichaceae bacterium]